MTFTISQASAIFVYSDVNGDHGQFSVTFTPPPELGQPVTTIYDGNAHWFSLDRVLFWAAGMDRDKSYTVKITNMATAGTPYFDFSHVDILDATSVGPAISSSTSTTKDASKVKGGTPIGTIVGGTIAGLIILIVLIISFLVSRQRKRNLNLNHPLHPFPLPGNVYHPSPNAPAIPKQLLPPIVRLLDEPEDESPPAYFQ